MNLKKINIQHILLTKKQNFCYIQLNIGSTKKIFGLNKSIVQKIMSLSSRQTKIQQNKLQIWSKNLTTTITNQNK